MNQSSPGPTSLARNGCQDTRVEVTPSYLGDRVADDIDEMMYIVSKKC